MVEKELMLPSGARVLRILNAASLIFAPRGRWLPGFSGISHFPTLPIALCPPPPPLTFLFLNRIPAEHHQQPRPNSREPIPHQIGHSAERRENKGSKCCFYRSAAASVPPSAGPVQGLGMASDPRARISPRAQRFSRWEEGSAAINKGRSPTQMHTDG